MSNEKAYEQYKGPKSSRMILYIASEMASQYFAVDKFVIAKKYSLQRMQTDIQDFLIELRKVIAKKDGGVYFQVF